MSLVDWMVGYVAVCYVVMALIVLARLGQWLRSFSLAPGKAVGAFLCAPVLVPLGIVVAVLSMFHVSRRQ